MGSCVSDHRQNLHDPLSSEETDSAASRGEFIFRRSPTLLARLEAQRSQDNADQPVSPSHPPADLPFVPPEPDASKPTILRIRIVTWNLAGSLPLASQLPESLLLPSSSSNNGPFDLIAIGSQECQRSIAKNVFWDNKDAWERALDDVLLPHSYRRLVSLTLVGVHLAIYVRLRSGESRDQIVVRSVVSRKFPLLIGGNKGAVAVRAELLVDEVLLRILFVCAHLRHGDERIAERNREYWRLMRGLESWGRRKRRRRRRRRRKKGIGISQIVESSSSEMIPSFSSSSPRLSSNPPPEEIIVVDHVSDPGHATTTTTSAGKSYYDNEEDEIRVEDVFEDGTSITTTATTTTTTTSVDSSGGLLLEHSLLSSSSEELVNIEEEEENENENDGTDDDEEVEMEEYRRCRDQVLSSHDAVFFFGDLNYRINGSIGLVNALLKDFDQNRIVLTKNDQLSKARVRNEAFSSFVEGPLIFRPTYRFGEDREYTPDRIPSWTDRILYRTKLKDPLLDEKDAPDAKIAIRRVEYDADFDCTASDHRPVFATFELVEV